MRNARSHSTCIFTDMQCCEHSAPEGVKVDETIQVELTIDILKQIYKEPKKETRKQLCQLLGKLHIPDSLDEWQCKNILLLISQLDNVSASALRAKLRLSSFRRRLLCSTDHSRTRYRATP